MPRGRYRQKQWETRQAAILEALTRLAATHGFANVTMDALADEVGISKATLYQHFKSKDEMLAALLAAHIAHFMEWLAQTSDRPPLERLRLVVRYLMDGHMAPLRSLIRRGELSSALEERTELVAQYRHMLDQLSAIVVEGQRSGQIAPELAPSVVIRMMWALSHVPPEAHTPLHRQETLPDRETYIAHVLSFFERGLRP